MKIIQMPEMPREAFPDDETYRNAVESSHQREYAAMSDVIDITGLDKCDVLTALYDNGVRMGMGFLADDMNAESIRKFVTDYQSDFNGQFPYIDYLGGKPLKVNLSGDTFDGRLYDRDQGTGAARKAVDGLRSKI